MAEASYPFDGGSGSIITEQQWSNMSATWQDNGVIAVGPTSSALKVTTLNQVGIVYVEAGEANVLGFHYENTSQLPVAVPSNLTSLTRIDLIVLQLDKNTNAVRVAYREGLAASSPVPPTLVTSGGVYEIALAQIQMNPNTTQVPNTEPQLVDKRTFIGKRIQPTEDVANLPVGAIGYKPSDGKFYAKNGSGTLALGAPPDLSAYATTSAVNTLLTGYSPTSHTHAGGGGSNFTVCTSTTRPASPTLGDQIHETNTERILYWNGSTWVAIGFTPAMIRRSGLAITSISVGPSGTQVPMTATDFTVGTWPTQSGNTILFPTYPTSHRWAIDATVSIVGATSSNNYSATISSGVDEIAADGTIGDDTSTIGNGTVGFSLSGIITIASNATQTAIFGVTRPNGSATTANVGRARFSAHRIG